MPQQAQLTTAGTLFVNVGVPAKPVMFDFRGNQINQTSGRKKKGRARSE